MINIESEIRSFDQWMSNDFKLKSVNSLDSIGFRHFNDLLLLNYFPRFLELPHLNEHSSTVDDFKIKEYVSLIENLNLSGFGFKDYCVVVQERLKNIPSIEELKRVRKELRNIHLQNLIILAFSLERWAQYSSGSKPGEFIKSSNIIKINDISIYYFIFEFLGKFNSLEYFVLKMVDTVNSFTHCPEENIGYKKKEFRINSPYINNEISESGNRYPSILKLDSFHVLIKKTELIAQAYNNLILDVQSSVSAGVSLESAEVISKVKEIKSLVGLSCDLMHNFTNDRTFNEFKFIYFLRQMTVETSESPYDILLKEFEISPSIKFKVKGLVNHFLMKKKFTKKESGYFLKELNRHRESSIAGCLKGFPFREVAYEIKNLKYVGVFRIKYVMLILAELIPSLSSELLKKGNDQNWLNDTRKNLNNLEYYFAPSGANSVAFFGLDTLMGIHKSEPHYMSHMINRLSVMTDLDRKTFWKLSEFENSGVHQKLQDIVDSSEGILASVPNTNSSSSLYVFKELFDEIARLACTHNNIVNIYLRRFSKAMDRIDKEAMVSSLEHGTTFMQPDPTFMLNKTSCPPLPSIRSLMNSRKNHILREIPVFKLFSKSEPRYLSYFRQ